MAATFQRDELERRLRDLTARQAAAFGVSCVERRRPAVRVITAGRRAADARTFTATLDRLWADLAGTLDRGDPAWAALDRFPEVTSGEDSEGPQAFADDAVVALYYVTRFVRSGDARELGDCASRCVDSAGFWDDEVGGSADFGDEEIRLQELDLAELEVARALDDVLLARLRSRSAAESVRAFGA